MHSLAACQRHTAGPQRIVRGWNQNFVSIVDQSLCHHIDKLTDAIACIDILQRNILYILDLAILHDRFSGGKYPMGVGISLGVPKCVDHIQDHFLRRTETEGCRISYVQF